MARDVKTVCTCDNGESALLLHDLVLIGWKRAALTILASMLYGSWGLMMMEGEKC